MKKILKIIIILASFIGTISCRAEDIKNLKSANEAKETLPPKTDNYDLSDLSHWNLTVSAWEQLAKKDYEGVFVYARKCLELYEEKAKETAKSMRRFVWYGHEDDYALVNDAATCHYIMGEAYMKQKKNAEAVAEFNLVIKEYPYAQCWDPKGWFWKVAEVSQKNIDKIKRLERPE